MQTTSSTNGKRNNKKKAKSELSTMKSEFKAKRIKLQQVKSHRRHKESQRTYADTKRTTMSAMPFHLF